MGPKRIPLTVFEGKNEKWQILTAAASTSWPRNQSIARADRVNLFRVTKTLMRENTLIPSYVILVKQNGLTRLVA